MLTSDKIKKIKQLNRNLTIHHKKVLKEVCKLFGKKITYPTFLAFLRKEGEPTRRELRSRMKRGING